MPSQRRKYTQETMDAIARRFDAAPPAPKHPNDYGPPALVQMLAPKIRLMVDKGYSWPAMARMMADEGVTISPNVLRKYAAGSLDKTKTKKKTKSGPRPLESRPHAVPSAAQVPPKPSAREVTAPDDAWDDIEPIEVNDHTPHTPVCAPSGVLPRAPAVPPTEPAKVTAAGRTRSSSFFIRPDTEKL